jgi:3-methyladenine DNA glycosylase AlkC
MAEQLKNMFNAHSLGAFVNYLQKKYPGFEQAKFFKTVFDENWEKLELKARVRHIALTLGNFLPSDFPTAADILSQTAQSIKNDEERIFAFEFIFLPDFVEVFGLNHFEQSIEAIEIITQLISAEFAVRPFIQKYPEKMMAQMLAWSKHPNAMVRRLASEGSRPRLPWGMALKALKKDPSPILPILENLKADEAETVRKSVANNLNDIAKDHPNLVLEIAEKWFGDNPKTDWIIKHACRTLLKKANDKALAHFGFNAINSLKVDNLTINQSVIQIGEVLEFSFHLSHQEAQTTKLRVEYAIDYIKSQGGSSRKVFQIGETFYEPQKNYLIQRKQRFQDFTTRKHYPGLHHLAIIVNGQEMIKTSFEVIK